MATTRHKRPRPEPLHGFNTPVDAPAQAPIMRPVSDLLALLVSPAGIEQNDTVRAQPDFPIQVQAILKETATQISRSLQVQDDLAHNDAWIRRCMSKLNLPDALATITAYRVIQDILRLYNEQDQSKKLELELNVSSPLSNGQTIDECWLNQTSQRVKDAILSVLMSNPAEPVATYRSLWNHLTTHAIFNLQPDTTALTEEQIESSMQVYLRRTPVLIADIERFLRLQSSILAQVYLDTPTNLLETLGLQLPPDHAELFSIPRRNDDLVVFSSLPYQAIREALALNRFERVDDTPYPTALLHKGSTQGNIQLRPPLVDENEGLMLPVEADVLIELMWQQQKELSDLDADALDALSAIWLSQAHTPNDDAIASVDDLLSMRGLKPKRNGQGQRGGYEPEQRAAILRALAHIQNLWLDIAEVETYEAVPGKRRAKAVAQTIQSRAFVITDRMGQRRMDGRLDIHTFIFRPGKVFAIFLSGPGRQTALLSAKALQYDLNNERWEKRLTRYFSWQWRCRAHSVTYKQPYRIETLLEAAGEALNTARPHRTRERLEKAMERLLADGVVKGWQYEQWDENIASQYGWAKKWLQATISVEPPDNIRNQYQGLGRYEAAAEIVSQAKQTPAANNTLAVQIEQHRRKRGLSQAAAAHQLGITQSYLSKLESGTAKPNLDLLERIQLWLQRN